MRAIPLLIISVFSFLVVVGSVSAEGFSITVDPAWSNREGYQSNITGDGWPVDFRLGENFTFTLKADYLENGTEYLFSFEIRYSSHQMNEMDNKMDKYNMPWEDRLVVTNASHHFIGNNTEEYVYNLTGQLTSEYGVPLNSCTMLEARVNFVKNPNAKNDTLIELANFTSQDMFLPNGEIGYESYYRYQCTDLYKSTLGERVVILGLIIALPLLFLFSIYKMFKLSIQGGDGGAWAALFWLTMMVLPLWIFSYFWVQPF